MASAMPVFPEVGSTSFWSARTVRRVSPSSTRLAATRSLTAPNGLYHSSLAYTCVSRNGVTWFRRTSGVGLSALDSRPRMES